MIAKIQTYALVILCGALLYFYYDNSSLKKELNVTIKDKEILSENVKNQEQYITQVKNEIQEIKEINSKLEKTKEEQQQVIEVKKETFRKTKEGKGQDERKRKSKHNPGCLFEDDAFRR
jgi:preprotein translocase subunit SecF